MDRRRGAINMKLTIYDGGDPSVGIRECEYVIELPSVIEETSRREFRDAFVKFVGDFFDCSNTIKGAWYDDECPDCNQKLIDGKCKKPQCITNGTLLFRLRG